MSTTTIRVPEELKARIARVAARLKTSPHNFIIEAIAAKAEAQERQFDFQQCAEQRLAKFAATGETIAWKEMRSWLEHRIADPQAEQVLPKKRRKT